MHIGIKWKQFFSKKTFIFFIVFILCSAAALIFVHFNHSFYERPIAEVIETDLIEQEEVVDHHQNEDQLFTQQIKAEVKNGEHKGESIQLMNRYALSRAFHQEHTKGDELFVSIDHLQEGNTELTGEITDIKRDKYLVITSVIFVFILFIIGKMQGIFSVVSLVVISMILSFALDIYMNFSSVNLLVVCGVSVILFAVTTLLFVNGFNEKSYAAIIATLLATFFSLVITYLVLELTAGEGLRFEEMSLVTDSQQTIFLAGLLIGSLGAVTDVTITMAVSLFKLYEKDPNVSNQTLKDSGYEIGKDIMGTMTNILFFVYISGSIPMMILYLKNASSLGYTISMNLSLELARAFSGGFGIVLAIPLGIYTSIFFVNLKRRKA